MKSLNMSAPGWPIELRAEEATESIWERSVVMLAKAFPLASSDQVDGLTHAAEWFVAFITGYDNLIDGDELTEFDASRIPAFATEAFIQYAAVIPPPSEFWNRFRETIAEFVVMTEAELTWRTTKTVPTRDEAVRWAVARAGMVKISAYALYHCHNDHRADQLARCNEMLDKLVVAVQLLDDILDWRSDLENETPSLLYSLAEELLEPETSWDQSDEFAELMYLRVIPYALQLARTQLRDALSIATDDDLLAPWLPALDSFQARINSFDLMISSSTTSTAVDDQDDPLLADPVTEDSYDTLVEALASRSPGLKHVVRFERRNAVTQPGSFIADVLFRSYAANALCAIVGANAARESGILLKEVEYLLSRRNPSLLGGWSFVPDCEDIPGDIDTLAEVGRFLLSMGLRSEVEPEVARVVDHLERRFAETEYLEVWLISPEPEVAPEWSEWIRRLWRRRFDPAALANFGSLLAELRGDGEPTSIERAIASQIARSQKPNGEWDSSWYPTRFFVDARCVRYLQEFCTDSSEVDNALELSRQATQAAESIEHRQLQHASYTALRAAHDMSLEPALLLEDEDDDSDAEEDREYFLHLEDPFEHIPSPDDEWIRSAELFAAARVVALAVVRETR